MTFRCGRCAELVKAGEAAAGSTFTCERCHHVNVVPDTTTAPPPMRLVRGDSRPGWWRPIPAAIGTVAVVIAGWGVWAFVGGEGATAAAPRSAAEALQQELVRKNIALSGDGLLNQQYQNLNARHFAGALPSIEVRWEPRLTEVGQLAERSFTLMGMFGNIGRKSVILLNPTIQEDQAAIARTLSHEMVHAFLHSSGDKTGGHGPLFQSVLRRLNKEGAFEGVVASDDERLSLRAWLDAESARLDAAHGDLERDRRDLEAERLDVERSLEDLNARMSSGNTPGRGGPSEADVLAITSKRDAYNQRAIEANERVDRERSSLDYFNREVARYNLMLVYPDGLDQTAMVKPKTR